LEVGREEKLDRITAEILPDNQVMQHLCKKLGFSLTPEMDVVSAIYDKLGTPIVAISPE
jgi:acetyltransferase